LLGSEGGNATLNDISGVVTGIYDGLIGISAIMGSIGVPFYDITVVGSASAFSVNITGGSPNI
jgi:hypothetical protein